MPPDPLLYLESPSLKSYIFPSPGSLTPARCFQVKCPKLFGHVAKRDEAFQGFVIVQTF